MGSSSMKKASASKLKSSKGKALKKSPAKKVTKASAKAKNKVLTPASKTVFYSFATGKEVTERYAKANPDKVFKKRVKIVTPLAKAKKTVAKGLSKIKKQIVSAARKPKTVVGPSPTRLESKNYLDGYQSSGTYLVVARQGKDKKAAIRWMADSEIRVHLFPNTEAIFATTPHSWKYRSSHGYSTCWMDRQAFEKLHAELEKLPGYEVMALDKIHDGSRALKGARGTASATA